MKNLKTKMMAMTVAASMIAGLFPATAFAVSGSEIAAEGTYTRSAHVVREAEDVDDEWGEYDVEVSLTVNDGKFSDITVTPENGYSSAESKSYFEKAYSKTKGFKTLLEGMDATEDMIKSWDCVGGATRTSDAIKAAALDAVKDAPEMQVKPEVTAGTYVLMNIPYDKFYEADVKNDVLVDAITSATKSKTRTGSLSGGSYHVNSDGSDITGITFPVKVGEGVDLSECMQVTDMDSLEITVTNRGQTTTTTYKGKEALFESASYSYYILSEEPSYYKDITMDVDGTFSFGSTKGEHKVLDQMSAELNIDTTYGDYQLDLTGLRDLIGSDAQIYGVIVGTTDDSSYGMRHLENIWRVEQLAWCTGFTDAVHNCPTSSSHYKSMMGKTINSVTYYTSNGIFDIPVEEIYVPVKFAKDPVFVADAAITAKSTEIRIENLPEDYQAVYSVEGLDISVKDGVMIFSDAKKGQYTLVVKDENGKYADLTKDFILYTEVMPVAYNEDNIVPALVKEADASDEEFADYLKNITAVSVNGKRYETSGRGAVIIISEDGTLKLDAAPFAEGGSFEITVSATGYQNLSFTWKKPEKLPYEDVAEGDWFYDGVYYNYFAETMTGKDDTHFAPLETLARAQFAVIIHRMNGKPETAYQPIFPDVSDNVWYTDAILWAANTGVVTGYTDTGLFGTSDNINREQMAVMMYRYANYLDCDTGRKADFDTFEDAASVSAYAGDAMRWAVGTGIITGKYEGTQIDPQGNALRGECAIIIQRFMEAYMN